MKKINVKVNQTTREVGLTRQIVGNQLENLQEELVFSFTDKFVDGQARLEYEIDNNKYWVTLDKVNETYTLPLNSQITSQEEVFMQLVISVDNGIFKSNVFSLYFANSINATTEQPEQYPSWIEQANEKLNQMDNINITANKVDNVATITVTRKDKTKDTVKIEDGAKGTKGDKGDIGATGNGISSIEKVDSVGLKTNYKINFTDGTNFNYSVNDGKTPIKGTDYYTEQDKQEMVNGIVTDANSDFNVNVEAKTNEFNSNAEAKTNTFNSNASSKVGEYNINAKKELDSYNDNATAKLKAYNDNHTAKLEEYNNNSIVKTGNYNDNADKQVADFNTNVITKTSEYNENATTKYNAYNTNDETKLKEYNDNATAKLAEFNLTASSKLNFKEYAVLGDRVSNEEANDIISKKEEYKDTIIYFKQGEENIGYGFVTYFGQDLVVVFYNTGEITSNNGYYEKTITYSRSQIYDKLKGKLDKKKIELKGNELTQEEATKVIEFAEDPDYYKEYHNALLSFVNTNYDEVAKGFVVTGNEELLYTFDKNGLTKWTKTNKEVLSSKEIASNTKRIKNIETNIFDSGVATGEFINIKDSALAEFQEITSSIAVPQETTKGYNVLNYNKQSFTELGLDFTINKDKTISIKGTSTSTGAIYIIPSHNRLSIKAGLYWLNGVESGKNVRLSMSAKGLPKTYVDSGNGVEINIAQDDDMWLQINIDKVGEIDTIIKPMMVLKEYQNAPYEPYTGGIASPNPDYPQKINTIKENWDTISTGKNLYNQENELGNINAVGDNEDYFGNTRTKGYQQIFPNKEYTINSQLQCRIAIRFYDENKVFIESGITNNSPSTFTTPYNARYARFIFVGITDLTNKIQLELGTEPTPYEPYQSISTPNDTGSSVVDRKDNFTFKWKYKIFSEIIPTGKIYVNYGKVTKVNPSYKPRIGLIDEYDIGFKFIDLKPEGEKLVLNIEKDCYGYILYSNYDDESPADSTTIEYVEFRKPNEFLPGDNITKRFNEADGKYWAYLEKNGGKTVLNGSETILLNETLTDVLSFWVKINDSKETFDRKHLHCNRFTPEETYTNNKECCNVGYGGVYFNIKKDRLVSQDIEGFKQWIKTNQVEVVYELENKQLIPIASLDQMNMTYNPETNLFSSIGNIKIEAKYYREFATTIRNMQIDNGKLQEQLNDMEKRIVALENKPAEVVEPVEESVVNA